jgi:hypothetical protein
MNDLVFDLLVQVYILGYLTTGDDRARCLAIVRELLAELQHWTKDFDEAEIENTAWIFIKHYEPSVLLDQLLTSLPKRIIDMENEIDALALQTEIQKRELRLKLCTDLFATMQTKMKTILDIQQSELNDMLWAQLRRETSNPEPCPDSPITL